MELSRQFMPNLVNPSLLIKFSSNLNKSENGIPNIWRSIQKLFQQPEVWRFCSNTKCTNINININININRKEKLNILRNFCHEWILSLFAKFKCWVDSNFENTNLSWSSTTKWISRKI
jgi:hypothetical protein